MIQLTRDNSITAKEAFDRISRILDTKYPLTDKFKGYLQACKQNTRIEAVCIGVCELGELASEMASYSIGIHNFNEIGLLGGIALGSSYAVYHIYGHAKEHGIEPRFVDAAEFVLSAESGCVIGATTAEYLAGRSLTTTNPFSGVSLAIRVTALPIAFGIGLGIIGASAYKRRSEVLRFAGRAWNLGYLKELYGAGDNCEFEWNKDSIRMNLILRGGQSQLSIVEEPIPGVDGW